MSLNSGFHSQPIARHGEIKTDCPNNLIVMSDRMRLKQIVLNLAAMRFVEQGYIQLQAEVANDNVTLLVEDSGPGIPRKSERLFAKFKESLDLLNQVPVLVFAYARILEIFPWTCLRKWSGGMSWNKIRTAAQPYSCG
jgi:hypothetical protein